MKTSLIISIALFAVFSIPEISWGKEICKEFKDICFEDSDCCSGNCYSRAGQPYCIESRKITYDNIKVGHGICSYNKTFQNSSSELMFELFGLNVAHSVFPASTKIQLTMNNKTIDVLVNNEQPLNHSILLELSKEVAEALNITEEGFTPCSVVLYDPVPDYSTVKNVLGVSASFFVVVFIVMTFL